MRKLKWKKVVSTVVAASMIVTLAPIDAGASSAQGTGVPVAAAQAEKKSIEDVLEQADKTGTFGTGVNYWYFTEAIEGVVDAGTLYIKGTEGTESLTSIGSWDDTVSPIVSLKIKNLSEIASNVFNSKKNIKTVEIEGVATVNGAFQSCTSLTTVKLDGVTTIGSYIFSYCASLDTVELGDAVTSVGNNAFYYCTSLTHISIPAGVTALNQNVFANCTALRDIALRTTTEETVTLSTANDRGGIRHPFLGCDNLTIYVASEGNQMSNAITGFYTGERTDAFASTANSVHYTMSTLDKYDAKSVPSGKLEVSCPDIRMDKLPPQPKVVTNTTGIADANITWSYYSSSKTAVDVADMKWGSYYVRATISDDSHFAMMSDFAPFTVGALFTSTVEDGVLTIAPGEGVESCEIPDFSSSYDSTIPWKEEEFSSVVIADGITSIGNYAFANKKITSVTIGADVTKIGNYAFQSTSLESIDLTGSKVTEIGTYAFQSCASLKVADFSQTQITSLGSRAFASCTSLEKVKLPSALTSMGTYIFQGCTALRTVIGLEDTQITSVPERAFYGCTALEVIKLPETATSISTYAFYNGTSLEQIVMPGTGLSISGTNAFTNVTAAIYVKDETEQSAVRTALDSLDAYAGDADKEASDQKIRVIAEGDVKKLSYFSIALDKDEISSGESFQPTITEKVGDGEITYWYYQKSGNTYELVDSDNPTAVPTVAGTYYIKGHMAATAEYYGCTSNMVSCMVGGIYEDNDYKFDTSTGILTIKGDYQTVPWEDRFPDYKTRIKEIHWAEGITQFPSFMGCTGLKKIVDVPYFNNNSMFYQCTSLTDVTFAEGFEAIPYGWFYGCASLSQISIPDTVTSIGSQVFCGTAIQEILLPDGLTRIDGGAFQGTALQEVVIPDSVSILGSNAFSGCKNLTAVTIGENSELTSIEGYAFKESALESITIPSKISTIGDQAFSGCVALKEVDFLAGEDGTAALRNVQYGAFYGCTSLESITLPKSISGITLGTTSSYGVFQGCTSLRTVDMSQAYVRDIYNNTFADCTHLEELTFYQPEEQQYSGSINKGAFTNAGAEADSFVLRLPSNIQYVFEGAFDGSGVTEIIWEDDTYSSSASKILTGSFKGASCLEKLTLKRMDFTEEEVAGIVDGTFCDGCPDSLAIYAAGDTYALLQKYGYTNAVDYQEVVAEKKTEFEAQAAVYKGLDTSLYEEEALNSFLEDSVSLAEDTIAGITAEGSGASVFDQADIIDATAAFLDEAYFGEGGLVEGAAKSIAALTDGLDETDYTAESWKALTDAQKAVADFMSEEADTATVSQVSVLEEMLKAAVAAKDALKDKTSETESPAPGTPAPESPAPGAPAPGTPAPGTPAPESPAPGTPAPGAPAPGTPAPTDAGNATVAVKKVAGVKAKAQKKAMKVTWKKVSGVKGYQISYGTKKNFKGAKKVLIKKNTASYTIKKLKKGKVYYVRVRAYKESAGKKSYGKWSAVKKAKIK